MVILNKNKKGWIRIMEAFLAILLVVGVLLVILNQSSVESNDISERIYRDELSIVNIIEYNSSLRASILGISSGLLPLESRDVGFPLDVNNTINANVPSYLFCITKICMIEQDCVVENPSFNNVYTIQRAIFANNQIYSPRKLVLFCSDLE